MQIFNESESPLTVAQLIEILSSLPQDATCRAYESEIVGIVIEKDGSDIAEILTQ